MPRDEWKRARERDKAKRQKRRPKGVSKKILDKVLQPTRIATRLSWNTTLWFGKHKGRRLHEAPPAYLLWLHANCRKTKSRTIQGLLLWIGCHKQELQRMLRSQEHSETEPQIGQGSAATPRIDQAGVPEQSPRWPILSRSYAGNQPPLAGNTDDVARCLGTEG